MGEPSTDAGRALLRANPELPVDAIAEVERQAHGQGIAEGSERSHRVLDRLREVLTPEQLAAASAVLALDPDAIAALDDATLRIALAGLSATSSLTASTPEAREAALRYLNEIM